MQRYVRLRVERLQTSKNGTARAGLGRVTERKDMEIKDFIRYGYQNAYTVPPSFYRSQAPWDGRLIWNDCTVQLCQGRSDNLEPLLYSRHPHNVYCRSSLPPTYH
jgi:hypothetical protein